jgi:cell division protein FtsW (lipid II flippase)
MALTRSWTAPGARPQVVNVPKPAAPRSELVWLLGASLLVAAGLAMVYAAKSEGFAGAEERLKRGELVNVNRVNGPEQLLPLLESSSNRAERELVAQKTFDFLARARPLGNVGALARLRVSAEEIEGDPRWDVLRRRLRQQQAQSRPARRFELVPLAIWKPLMVVRSPREFRAVFLEWTALYFAGFYLVALVWGVGRFWGDRAFLPALHLLTGIGLILMASMRDPLRDTLEFRKFSLGVLLGCLLLALPVFKAFDYRRLSEWCYTPLAAALGLFALLLAFGRGPGGNDAKVNLGPFQPVELIKILIVLFLAGYFTRNWERLRDLREKRGWPRLFRRIGLPRLEHVVPVLCAVGVAAGLFFLLKDMGPALVAFWVFLAMFGVARGRPGLALAGLALLVASVAAGYHQGQPRTVAHRIDMWLSPWDNDVHGGDQLAHAIWAFSTGGPTGSGPGWGDPQMIPAGNTDLVLPAIGEEWGFAGVAAVFGLFGFLIWRALAVAGRAGTRYGFFLALGLASLIVFEMLLITAGVLGVLPLSGVVSPFLSSGNTAMLANFLVFAVLLAISADQPVPHDLLRKSMRPLKAVLACAGLVLLATAARYQVVQDRDYLARDRNVRLTVDIRLEVRAREILERHLRESANTHGAVVVMDAATGDVLALVSAPAPEPPGIRTAAATPDELLDRARYGQYPPGSTFKLVTAIAALRADPGLKHRTYLCRTLRDGRAGTTIAGWNRPVKDDIGDQAHGTLDMQRAIVVSCNAYFAQLGAHDVGAKALAETAAQMGISTGEMPELRRALPFAAYGQGPVLISPFKMARVAAAIATGGRMPLGRWILDGGNSGTDGPVDVLPPAEAAFLAGAMRRVVTEGTARHAMSGAEIGFAGKTGTAQLDQGLPHAWFAGFAPYDGDVSRRLAFAVLVEHGGYGARVAAPIAREVMEAAEQLGILERPR